ncbi:ATPase family AAA domain-containing protein 1-B-like [Trypanosoma conorhini]|uniref:ATPase family AAA domain-containing protein 1-B-like n=1 Tax=Trypanosoma conorhini TaxID=83891 RepID=A0A422NBC1_9TRYP|nr:ATPase family AAA domain-containing protein 1-B-like [Trypanosoma conorhini]RNF02761.1 ATPase family AAA domain-containing protein 1-B-like [Trypanosoma conorhini]
MAQVTAVSVRSTVLDALKCLGEYVAKQLKEIPISFWISLPALLYATRQLAYLYGFSKKEVIIGGRSVHMTCPEAAIAEGVIDPAKIKENFSQVGGLENAKSLLRDHVVWPFTHPELFAGNTLRSHPKGVLLYGRPGTGKHSWRVPWQRSLAAVLST